MVLYDEKVFGSVSPVQPRLTVRGKDERTFAKVRSYDIDLGFVSDEAHASRLITVGATQTGAEIAVTEMSVGLGALQRSISGSQRLIARHVAVEQKRRCQMEVPALRARPRCVSGHRGCPSSRTHEEHHLDKFSSERLQSLAPCRRRDLADAVCVADDAGGKLGPTATDCAALALPECEAALPDHGKQVCRPRQLVLVIIPGLFGRVLECCTPINFPTNYFTGAKIIGVCSTVPFVHQPRGLASQPKGKLSPRDSTSIINLLISVL